MPRDETRDVWVSVWADSLHPRIDDQCIADGPGVLDDWRDDLSEARYVPHSQLADLERQLAEAKTERDYWRKKHKEDNEGLMFQLGRNLEFAQAAAFRHGATEPHATIKCIQIIDEHAESLQRQLADRDNAIRQLQEAMNELRAKLEKSSAEPSCEGCVRSMGNSEMCLHCARSTSFEDHFKAKP